MKILSIFLMIIIGCTSKNQFQPEYHPFSTSSIKVTFQSPPKDTVNIIAFSEPVIPHKPQRSKTEIISKKGDYYLTIAIDRPSVGFINLNKELYRIFIVPNDTVEINVTPNLEFNFYGHWSEINGYYLNKRDSMGYVNTFEPFNTVMTSNATYNKIRDNTNSIVSSELDFLNDYFSKNSLPDWFIKYEKSEIIYSGAFFKLLVVSYNKSFNTFNDNIPIDYYEFLNNLRIDNPDAIFSGNYFNFLDEYFRIELDEDGSNNLSGLESIRLRNKHIRRNYKGILSPKIENIYNQILFSEELQYLSDTTKIDSLALAYGIANNSEFKDYQKRQHQAIDKENRIIEGDTIPEFWLTTPSDSLISLRQYSNKKIYLNFWASWCKPCLKNIPELNKMIVEFSKSEDLEFINICFQESKEKWLIALDKYNLYGTNLLAEGNWIGKLSTTFGIYGLPHYVILGEGNTLFKNNVDKAPAVIEDLKKLITLDAVQH